LRYVSSIAVIITTRSSAVMADRAHYCDELDGDGVAILRKRHTTA
jgi:hypothetical protein